MDLFIRSPATSNRGDNPLKSLLIYGIFPFCLIPASFVTSIEAICETFFPLWCVYQAINFRFIVGLYFA